MAENLEIAGLKAEIEGYKTELSDATDPADKRLLRELIITRSKTLNILLSRAPAGIIYLLLFRPPSNNLLFSSCIP